MPLPIIGYVAIGAAYVAARGAMIWFDNREAGEENAKASRISSDAFSAAVSRLDDLNKPYRTFFDRAQEVYARIYAQHEEALPEDERPTDSGLTPPRDLKFIDKFTPEWLRSVRLKDIDWKLVSQHVMVANQRASMDAYLKPQSSTQFGSPRDAAIGRAGHLAAVLGGAALEGYASKVEMRKTMALKSLADAELYSEQVLFLLKALEKSIPDDAHSRALALTALVDGFEIAIRTADVQSIAPRILEEIKILIERPAHCPGLTT